MARFPINITHQLKGLGLPVSLVLFLLTGLLFLLQAFPGTGLALMLFGAPFWSVPLINAGFAGLAIETFARGLNKLWLIAPVAWFGGYGGLAAWDHWQLANERKEIAAHNAQTRIPFTPSSQALVFESESFGLSVTDYEVPVVYQKYQAGEGYLSSRMAAKNLCEELREAYHLESAGIYSFGVHDRSNTISGSRFENRFCTIRLPEKPRFPVVSVTNNTKQVLRGRLPVRRTSITVTDPDGTQYQLKGGSAAPLSWFPMPIIGCALNSGNPSWDCVARFSRESLQPLVQSGFRYDADQDALAAALGVKQLGPGERKATPTPEMRDLILKSYQEVVAKEIALLDRSIADPSIEIDDSRFGSLGMRLDILRPRLAQMISAIERGAKIGGEGASTSRTLLELVGHIPANEIAIYMPRINRVTETHSWARYRQRQFPVPGSFLAAYPVPDQLAPNTGN